MAHNREGAAIREKLFANLPPGVSVVGTLETAVNKNNPPTFVDVTNQPFQKALRFVSDQTYFEKPWIVGIDWMTQVPLKTNDLLLAVFWARAVPPLHSSGDGKMEVALVRNTPPFPKSGMVQLKLTAEWQKFFYPYQIKEDIAAKEAKLSFACGFQQQTIEIGGAALLRYPESMKLEDLPSVGWQPFPRETPK